MEKGSFENSEALELIKDESNPAIKNEEGNIIFSRDYDNRRVFLSMNLLGTLINNGQVSDAISYLKSTDKVDYITLYATSEKGTFMINACIKQNMTYLIPFKFTKDEGKDIKYNDDIYYTSEAFNVLKESGELVDDSNILEKESMEVYSIKNNETNYKFLPLFTSEEELRVIFSRNEYRICEVTYGEALKYAKDFFGIVFRPTAESFMLKNEVAGFFTGIKHYEKINKDYRRYTEAEKTIQDKIMKIGSMEKGSKEADIYYRGILQSINNLDKLYVILNKDEFDEESGTGIPLALTKDGEPSIYVFSELSFAKKWAEHYKYYSSKNIPLIAEIESLNDFDSIFKVAKRLGITLCMIDEGQATIGFNIDLFLDVNNCTSEMKLRINGEEAEKLYTKTEKVNLHFNKCKCIGMENLTDETLYYMITMK